MIDESFGNAVITITDIPTADLFREYTLSKNAKSFRVSTDMYMTLVMNSTDTVHKDLCKALYMLYMAKKEV